MQIDQKYTTKYLSTNIAHFSVCTLLNLFIAASVGIILLIAVYSLPTDVMQSNAVSSAEIMKKEGTGHRLFSWCTSTLDNFTDSLMLLNACNTIDKPLTEKSVNVYRGYIKNANPCKTFVLHYLDNTDYDGFVRYPRYWHGYLTILKPLLMIMDYSAIRIINGIFQLMLMLVLCILLKKRHMKPFIIPFIIIYLMLMPVALAKSLQYSTCYYIYTIFSIILLAAGKKFRTKYVCLIFLNIGICTAYFDLLTYPITTFGIPAIIYLALTRNDSIDLRDRLACIIKIGIMWCIGYGGMWAAKWVIGGLLIGNDSIIKSAVAAFRFRTSAVAPDGITHYSILRCIAKNCASFIRTPAICIAFVYIMYSLVPLLRKRGKIIRYHIVIPYMFIALAPIVWYIFATNHSYIHAFFTNKACSVSLLAVMFAATELALTDRKDEETAQPLLVRCNR